MIVIRLLGGLGNQMFQYAFGLAKSIEYNQGLFVDDTLLTTNSLPASLITPRKLELNIFPGVKIRRLPTIPDIIVKKPSHFLSKLTSRAKRLKFIRQDENEFVQVDNLRPGRINIVEGYFQSQEYFRKHSDRIWSRFSFPDLDDRNALVKSKMLNSNSVSLHIRRGDYAANPESLRYHGILPPEYYNKSIDFLKQSQSDISYFIFTDDIKWVKENFMIKEENLMFVEGNTGSESWKDMALMTFAAHHIIANSSFSWWGAWLKERQGFTLAPRAWFNSEVAKFDIHTIIPDNWIVID